MVERYPDKIEVVGSIPTVPTTYAYHWYCRASQCGEVIAF